MHELQEKCHAVSAARLIHHTECMLCESIAPVTAIRNTKLCQHALHPSQDDGEPQDRLTLFVSEELRLRASTLDRGGSEGRPGWEFPLP